LKKAEVAQIEGAQGFGLSIQHGFYPYTTSRDVTPAQIYADCGIPWDTACMGKILGITRTYPIRVNNKTGTSGPFYEDQKEISFADIGQEVELTTVTKLPRRLFTYSKAQMAHATSVCCPHEVMINFMNYCQSMEELIEIIDHMNMLSNVRYLGFGPKNSDVLDIGGQPIGTAMHNVYHWWERYHA
jgi:adenylosuccinate synthase